MANGPEFFQTNMGHKYYNCDLPNNTKAMNRLADAIEKSEITSDQVERLIDAMNQLTNALFTTGGAR